jgi:large subunit ribosomal protein L25
MVEQISLAAEKRTEFGKGAARRARAEGKIPAVLYGHGADPVHVLLPGHETMMALKHQNVLLSVEFGKDKEMAIAKDAQINPVRQSIEHVDLLLVRAGEKITVDVTVHVEGESVSGTIAVLENATLQVAAEATHLPEFVTVNVEDLDDGARIFAREVTMPEGSVLVTDGDSLVVAIQIPRQAAADEAAELAAEEAAAELAAEGAEGVEGEEGEAGEASEESSE